MRKRYHTIRNNRYGLLAVDNSKEPNKVIKRSNRKTLKFSLYSLLAIFLAMVGYIAFSTLTAANDIFTGGVSFNDLINKSSLEQTDGVTNILLLGKGGSNHPGGQLTDTIILVRMRHSDNKIAMISIPRDLYVSIPGNGKAKINEAYTTGYNSEKDTNSKGIAGAELSSKVVSTVAGVPVHYYLTADFSGFKEIVDTIGGVTVDVEKELYDPMYPNEGFTKDGQYYKTDDYEPLLIKAGTQTMDGELALKYVRSRHGTGVSDFDRAYRQQQVLFAIKEKSLSLGVLANPKKVSDILSSVSDHIRISMSASELREFLEKFSKVDKGSIINKVLDNSEDGLLESSNNGSSVLLPKSGDYIQIHNFVKNVFDTINLKGVEVEVYNGSSINGKAGELASKLEDAGLNVTIIDNYDQEIEKTIIKDGTSGGVVMDKIKNYVLKFKLENLSQSDKIVIIIGKDYGN